MDTLDWQLPADFPPPTPGYVPEDLSPSLSEPLLSLPRELLYNMLASLEPTELGRICQSNKELAAICRDRGFWKYKHLSTLGPRQRTDPRVRYYTEIDDRLQDQRSKLTDQLKRDMVTLFKSVFPSMDPIFVNALATRSIQWTRDTFFRLDPKKGNYGEIRAAVFRNLEDSLAYRSVDIDPNAEPLKAYPSIRNPLRALIQLIYERLVDYYNEKIPLEEKINRNRAFLRRLPS